MEDRVRDDLRERAAEVCVAAEMRVGLVAIGRDDPAHVHREQGQRGGGGDGAREPAPMGRRHPGAQAHHGQRGVFPAEERERGGQECQPRPARLHRPEGGQEQRDRERGRVEVAHVDPVERRVHQVEQREHGGGALVAEPGPGQAEHRDAAQGQRHRLGHQQDHRARGEPVGGHEEVHDRREMIAPGVHLGQAHVGAGAPRQVPHELDVVAEIECVRREGQVTGDRDEREHERVGRHPDQDGPAGPHRGDRPRGQQHAQRHEPQEQEEEVLGPPGPVLATARPEHECGAEPRRGQDGRAVEQPGDDHRRPRRL